VEQRPIVPQVTTTLVLPDEDVFVQPVNLRRASASEPAFVDSRLTSCDTASPTVFSVRAVVTLLRYRR
jgi:hypothetical protein